MEAFFSIITLVLFFLLVPKMANLIRMIIGYFFSFLLVAFTIIGITFFIAMPK